MEIQSSDKKPRLLGGLVTLGLSAAATLLLGLLSLSFYRLRRSNVLLTIIFTAKEKVMVQFKSAYHY